MGSGVWSLGFGVQGSVTLGWAWCCICRANFGTRKTVKARIGLFLGHFSGTSLHNQTAPFPSTGRALPSMAAPLICAIRSGKHSYMTIHNPPKHMVWQFHYKFEADITHLIA